MRMLHVAFMVFISLLLAYDYFSVLNEMFYILMLVFIGVLVCMVIFSTFFERRNNTSNSLKWQLFILLYITTLMGVFSLMGGKSTVGLSLTNKFIWIVIIISFIEMFFEWKRVDKKSV